VFPSKIYHEKKVWTFILLKFSPFLWEINSTGENKEAQPEERLKNKWFSKKVPLLVLFIFISRSLNWSY